VGGGEKMKKKKLFAGLKAKNRKNNRTELTGKKKHSKQHVIPTVLST
jgi:hypothetical protein